MRITLRAGIVVCVFIGVLLIGAMRLTTTHRGARYEVDRKYKIAPISLAKRCEMKDLNVERRALDDFTSFGKARVCVERRAASLSVVPDYAMIESLSLHKGYGLVLKFSGKAKRQVSKTMDGAGHDTVVVYRDNEVFKFVEVYSGKFSGSVNFWYDSLEEAERDMDVLRAAWKTSTGAVIHGDGGPAWNN